MKTNLIKRTLSLAIVICMVIAMVAVAPMVSAAENPPLTFGIDVYEFDDKGVIYVRASIYMTGYCGWTNPINNFEVHMNFDNTKLTFAKSNVGATPYKAFTTLPGQTITASQDAAGVTAANTRGYVVFVLDGPATYYDEGTEENYPCNIPQTASATDKVYLRSYSFTVKEGASGACDFSYDTTKIYVTNSEAGIMKIINGTLREGDQALTASYSIPAANYVISYNANGGNGTMGNTEGADPVVAGNNFTRAGYTFAGWNTAADGTGTTVAAGTAPKANTTLYAIWTKNATSEVGSWYKMIGAQAREATETKAAGMRFGVNLADLVAGVTIEEAGMIVIPTDKLTGELTHDTPDCATGVFTGYLNDPSDNSLIYTAVLVNIPAGQEARPITARGFVKVDGKYYYTDPIVRNYAEVLALLRAMQ